MTTKPEIYVSTDIEADGEIPPVSSMLSFGSAAYLPDGSLFSTFEANLNTLPGAVGTPDTMAWWLTQPTAWELCRKDPKPPEEVMPQYVDWLKKLPGRPVCVCYPAGYDFVWLYWYLMRFAGESPFSFSALDIKSYGMALLGADFYKTTKRSNLKKFKGSAIHSHEALADATEQGQLFCNLLKLSKSRVSPKK